MNRRDFICKLPLVIAGSTNAAHYARADAPTGFFRLEKRRDHWFFIDPSGAPFFSIGLNHIDSSVLRHPENIARWEQAYGNSQIRWIKESVRPQLLEMGFNSVGWVQEVTIQHYAHSPSFTPEEYWALDMPYCHLLPFAETHQWNQWHRNPDFFSNSFVDWCDYVAREWCARLKDDPNLIGYFYVDCPTWSHSTKATEWRGPLFDPSLLDTVAGKRELFRLAKRYYQVTHDAVRRYDRNHLVLGDRYEANALLPEEVVNAALAHVDVLCFQDFKDPVRHLAEWHAKTGKPVLWADGAKSINIKDESGIYSDGEYRIHDGAWYAEVLAGLRENPGCVGSHLCGAFIRNRFRKRGLLDEQEQPADDNHLSMISQANRETLAWIRTYH